MTDRPTLADTAQIYVTLAAATRYGDARGLQPGEAQRELTELLLDAKRRREAGPGGEPPEQWRYRSRARGVQITATVAREGRLAVVTHVVAESYR